MRVMTITKTIKMNHVTPGTVLSGELNKSSKSNSPIIMTPVFTIARPGAPKAGTVRCVRERVVPVMRYLLFCIKKRVYFVWLLLTTGFQLWQGSFKEESAK